MVRNFFSLPTITVGDPSRVRVVRRALDDGLAVSILHSRSDDDAVLYLSFEAARDLASKLLAAVEDAPGSSAPVGGVA